MNIAVIAVSEKHFNEVVRDFVPSYNILKLDNKYAEDRDGNKYYYIDCYSGSNNLMGRSIDKVIDMSPVSINTLTRFSDLSKAEYRIGGIDFVVKSEKRKRKWLKR